MDAETIKIYLANEMADIDCYEDENLIKASRYDYYYNMRDFDLLNIWMDKCGLDLLKEKTTLCLN